MMLRAKRRALTPMCLIATLLSVLALAGRDASAGAGPIASPLRQGFPLLLPAGLWDKPNEACVTQCKTYVNKGCFKELSEKDPTADPASLQEQCDAEYSICLYDCMCDTCDENQIILKKN